MTVGITFVRAEALKSLKKRLPLVRFSYRRAGADMHSALPGFCQLLLYFVTAVRKDLLRSSVIHFSRSPVKPLLTLLNTKEGYSWTLNMVKPRLEQGSIYVSRSTIWAVVRFEWETFADLDFEMDNVSH